MIEKNRIASLAAAALAAGTLLAGCTSGPRAYPGGATEAAVFFTPQVREARASAGLVYRDQSPEYARRDHAVGARTRDATPLYSSAPRSRTILEYERVRATSTGAGYTLSQESSVRVRRAPSNPFAPSRRR